MWARHHGIGIGNGNARDASHPAARISNDDVGQQQRRCHGDTHHHLGKRRRYCPASKVIADVTPNVDSLNDANSGTGGDQKDTVGILAVSFPIQGAGVTYSLVLKAINATGDTTYVGGPALFTASDISLAGAVTAEYSPGVHRPRRERDPGGSASPARRRSWHSAVPISSNFPRRHSTRPAR